MDLLLSQKTRNVAGFKLNPIRIEAKDLLLALQIFAKISY